MADAQALTAILQQHPLHGQSLPFHDALEGFSGALRVATGAASPATASAACAACTVFLATCPRAFVGTVPDAVELLTQRCVVLTDPALSGETVLAADALITLGEVLHEDRALPPAAFRASLDAVAPRVDANGAKLGDATEHANPALSHRLAALRNAAPVHAVWTHVGWAGSAHYWAAVGTLLAAHLAGAISLTTACLLAAVLTAAWARIWASRRARTLRALQRGLLARLQPALAAAPATATGAAPALAAEDARGGGPSPRPLAPAQVVAEAARKYGVDGIVGASAGPDELPDSASAADAAVAAVAAVDALPRGELLRRVQAALPVTLPGEAGSGAEDGPVRVGVPTDLLPSLRQLHDMLQREGLAAQAREVQERIAFLERVLPEDTRAGEQSMPT